MSTPPTTNSPLPPEQQAIRDTGFDPSGTFVEFPVEEINQSIPDRFEKIVAAYSSRLAVKTNQAELTYDALNRQANRVAHALLARHGSMEEPILLLLDNGAPMIASIIGVLKAGKIYVPLDPSFPILRYRQILEDTTAGLIVTDSNNLSLAVELAAGKLALVNIDELDRSACDDNPRPRAAPDAPAYILYTSGSTGKPKGVLQNHRNVLHLIMRHTNRGRVGSEDRIALLRSFGVHGGTYDTFAGLLNGAAILPFDIKRQGMRELAKWLAREQITLCRIGPTPFRHLAQALGDADRFPRLRMFSFSGEPLRENDIELCRRYFSRDCILVNSYGATEVSSCCEQIIDPKTRIEDGAVPCGTAARDMKIYLVDDNGKEALPGEIGEIAVKSRYLALGYWKRPELTRAAFRPDPDGGEERVYRTGDLGRMLPDGRLLHVGRKDFQVKIRGYRVEAGEVEAALLALDNIKEAVVVARQDREKASRLVAYLVPTPNTVVPTANALRRALVLRLPDYMIPSTFVRLGALPLTPNGKIDRRALPEPDTSRPNLDTPYAAPRTPVEAELERIWVEVLSLDQVGIHDSFLDVGGHSLAATRIISRVAKKFQFEMPLQSFFRSPAIAEMATVIAEHQARKSEKNPGVTVTPGISRRTTRESAPFSFAQQRLWFLNQLEPESPAYNEPKAVRLIGSLNISALHEGLKQLVARHEVLRTTFAVDDGVPQQRVAESTSIEFPMVDLSAQPNAVRDTEVKKLLTDTIRYPFDLSRDLMLRALLIRLADQEHLLLLVTHHIAFDRWSSAILWHELAAVYEAVALGRSFMLSELPIQYADFALWQRQCLQEVVFDKQLAYWKKQLEGVSILRLPTDRPNTSMQGHGGDRRSLKLPEELAHGLKALSRQEGVTLFMTLLAAFQTLLHRYTGQEDIVVGSPVAGRTRPETESLIGFFINTLVLRADLSGNPTFRELLGKVCEVALGAYANQDLPFEKLVEELQPERSLTHTPLFQVVFALQNVPSQAVELPGVTSTSIEANNGTAKFELSVFVVVEDDDLIVRIDYDTGLFDSTTITRMLGHFETLLRSIVANPEQRISDLPILREAERHQLVVEWNDTGRDYPRNKCIHELFEEQVEKSPDAIAVVFEDQQLTYGELNRRANQLAHYLKKLGVGPEALVAVCMERSLDLIVGVLGILKAGGAYVPLDPNCPAERLQFMLEDTQVRVLVTQEKVIETVQQPACSNQCSVVCLDRDWQAVNCELPDKPKTQAMSHNLAYVIYTSGSTGQPKGVQITHKSLLNLVFWHHQAFSVTHLDRATQLAGPGFDAAVWEFWPYLTRGASIHIPDEMTRLDAASLRDWLVARAITISFVPTALAESLITLDWPQETALRILLTGGDTLRAYPPETLPFRVFNNYGPTECTVVATSAQVWPNVHPVHPPTIGRPVANTEIYILDSGLRTVPIGVQGEVYIGGTGLARGYLNRPELTAEKFINHSFDGEPSRRLYRTGDLARYLPDGNIEFLGRIDNQVKIRGFRIELGEIEIVLMQHPAVRESAVIAREDMAGDKQLVAYIVLKGTAPETGELRAYLKTKLPSYMVPSAFVLLDSLPLTPHGKVDCGALPSPDRNSADSAQVYVGPRNAVEEIIAGMWAEILGIKQIGMHDNFFDLGGHSLKATQVVSRLRKALQSEIPLRHLFEFPTIAELANAILTQQAATLDGGALGGILAEVEECSEGEAQREIAECNNG